MLGRSTVGAAAHPKIVSTSVNAGASASTSASASTTASASASSIVGGGSTTASASASSIVGGGSGSGGIYVGGGVGELPHLPDTYYDPTYSVRVLVGGVGKNAKKDASPSEAVRERGSEEAVRERGSEEAVRERGSEEVVRERGSEEVVRERGKRGHNEDELRVSGRMMTEHCINQGGGEWSEWGENCEYFDEAIRTVVRTEGTKLLFSVCQALGFVLKALVQPVSRDPPDPLTTQQPNISTSETTQMRAKRYVPTQY